MPAAPPVKPLRFAIGGMSCAGGVASVETALREVPGALDARVNLAEPAAHVSGTPDPATLIAAVREAGYAAAELREAGDQQDRAPR
ncbi:MAG: cation transporter [Candidatus Competibacteraceae bacterium]|nr:cation transporter [Candidatus Competibacteraceae bacterium]